MRIFGGPRRSHQWQPIGYPAVPTHPPHAIGTEGHAIGTEASIFARRLKLLNFLPSFTVNFAPAQKKSCRGPLGCSDAHTLPAAAWAPRGRQTLNRTQLLPTTKSLSLRPGDLPIVFSTPCQMGNFATASRRESDPFPPTRSRGVQRDSSRAEVWDPAAKIAP